MDEHIAATYGEHLADVYDQWFGAYEEAAIEMLTQFAQGGRWNTHEVAQAIAKRFPELAWHLPRKRKPWQSEPKKQLIFDAAALARP